MTSLLINALLLGMTSASLVTIFRAIPPGQGLVKTGRKPWACDICMSFWATFLLTLAVGASGLILSFSGLLAAVPSYIVCLWFLKQTKDIMLFPEDWKNKD